MVGDGYGFLAIEFDVLEEILPVDEIEAQFGDGFIEGVGQFSPHLPEQPIEGGPDGKGVGEDLALSIVVLDEIDKRLLRFVLGLADIDQLLLVELVVVIQMEDLLRKQGVFGSIEVLFSVVEFGGEFVVG